MRRNNMLQICGTSEIARRVHNTNNRVGSRINLDCDSRIFPQFSSEIFSTRDDLGSSILKKMWDRGAIKIPILIFLAIEMGNPDLSRPYMLYNANPLSCSTQAQKSQNIMEILSPLLSGWEFFILNYFTGLSI